jgi:hypothetical protein
LTSPLSGHDPQQPPGHAQADPLGLGDGSELMLLVERDLNGVFQSGLEGLDLGLPLGKLPLKFFDLGLNRSAIDSLDDLLGLAIQRLP